MKGLLWVLALFALAAGASLAAHYNEGYLVLVYPSHGGTQVSLNLAILVVLLAFVLFYAILRGVAAMLALPGRARTRRDKRQQEKTLDELHDAMRLLLEGNFAPALQKAEASYVAGVFPATSALLAARAAQQMNEGERQKRWLDRAVENDPRMQVAALLLETEMHLEASRFDEAVSSAQRVHEWCGLSVPALQLEWRAQQGRGNEAEAERVAWTLENHEAARSGRSAGAPQALPEEPATPETPS